MILVFGKTGQIATELQNLGNVLALDRNFADLSNPSSCYDAIKTNAPKAVINAAAYTNVDKAETDEELANVVNANSPKAMAQACETLNIPLVICPDVFPNVFLPKNVFFILELLINLISPTISNVLVGVVVPIPILSILAIPDTCNSVFGLVIPIPTLPNDVSFTPKFNTG